MKLKTAENCEKYRVLGNKNHWQFMKSLTDFAFEEEYKRGKVVIFSTEFEPGKRLNAPGGIVAILRFGV
jgi:stalled ribosome rescue protein Dom34